VVKWFWQKRSLQTDGGVGIISFREVGRGSSYGVTLTDGVWGFGGGKWFNRGDAERSGGKSKDVCSIYLAGPRGKPVIPDLNVTFCGRGAVLV